MTQMLKPLQSKSTIYWLATLTHENGLNELQITNAKNYFGKMEYCLATHEKGKSGDNDHIHAIFVHSKTKSDLIKREIKKLVYGLSVKEKINVHMIRVEKVKSVMATINYVSKDIVDGQYFVQTGFQTTWIQSQLKEQFDTKRFFDKWHMVKVDQAPGCIMEFCKLNNIVLTNKDDFINIVSDIADSGVNIRTWIKQMEWIYGEVMARFGDKSKRKDLLRNALNFMT